MIALYKDFDPKVEYRSDNEPFALGEVLADVVSQVTVGLDRGPCALHEGTHFAADSVGEPHQDETQEYLHSSAERGGSFSVGCWLLLTVGWERFKYEKDRNLGSQSAGQDLYSVVGGNLESVNWANNWIN